MHSLVRTMTAAIATGRSFTLAPLLYKQNTPLIQPFAGEAGVGQKCKNHRIRLLRMQTFTAPQTMLPMPLPALILQCKANYIGA